MSSGDDNIFDDATLARIEAAIADQHVNPALPHDDQGSQLNFTIWLLAALSCGFLSLRIYCKFLRGRGLWWDDYVLCAAWGALAIACATTSASVSLGYGRHFYDIRPDQRLALNLVSNVAGTFSILAALWSKTSFAITVLRISSGWMRWTIWFIIMSLSVVMGASAMFEWIKCSPIEKSWKPLLKGTCWPQEVVITYYMFTTSYSGAMDIILALFPWKIIWGMMMNKKEKIGVLFAMSMGVFAGSASLIKVTKIDSLGNSDPSTTVQLVVWGVAESAITIIAASIPILRALLRDSKASMMDVSTPIGETDRKMRRQRSQSSK